MALDYTIAQTVMMQLGSFQFGIATAAYQELNRSTAWRWPTQERFGQRPVLQFTGPDAETISLPGVIFGEWSGGTGQLDAMRAMGEAGEPLELVDGNGGTMGRWVIISVDEGQTVFAANGVPRRQEFTLELKRFHDDGAAQAVAVVAAAAGAAGVSIPAGATTALAKAQGLASAVSTTAKSLSGTLNKVASEVQQTIAPYTAIARETLGAVNRSLAVVTELQDAANSTLSLIGVRPIEISALAGADNMLARANRALSRAESASAVLQTTSRKLAAIGNVPAGATRAMQRAQSAASQVVTATRNTAAQAATIKGE